MTTAATFRVSSRLSDRRSNPTKTMLSIAVCLMFMLKPVYAQLIAVPGASSSVVVGQLPAAFEVTRDNEGFVVTLVGIAPRDISGVQVGDQFVTAEQLGILGEGDVEIGSWSEFWLPLTVEAETIIVSLSNGAALLLPNTAREASNGDSQKAGVSPSLFLTVSTSKIFPKGSTTITVTPIGGNVGDTYVLNPLASTKGITITRTAARSFTVSGNTTGSYGLQVVAYRGSIKLAQSAIVKMSVISPAGWSSTTGYKYPSAVTVRGKMLAAANAAVGKLSGASIYCTDCGYLTDVSRDGPGLQRAMTTKVSWIGTNTAARDAQMNRDLSVTSYVTFEKNTLVARINEFVSTAPSNANQAVLSGLGIQAQCAEWVQRVAINAGATSARGIEIADGKGVAPGMSLRSDAKGHSALVVDVQYDLGGAPIDYVVVDANFGNSGWSHPGGDLPWKRLVRRAAISDHYGIKAYNEVRKHSDETISVGIPK